jgi:hypothetical protein
MPAAVMLDAADVVCRIDVQPDERARSEVGQILTAVEAVTARG